MNRKNSIVLAAVLGLTAGTLPALAADWNNGAGSLKDRGQAAVPVPAPSAMWETPSGWYIRLDAGIGMDSNHGLSEKGLVYGAGNLVDSYSATGAGFGSASSWMNGDTSININSGIGVGYSWGRNFRSDVTLERRSSVDYQMRGTYQYSNYAVNGAPPPAYTLVTAANADPLTGRAAMRIDGTTSDTTSLKSGVLMANTYYDWKTHSAFTPYIGAGIGVAYLDMLRKHTTNDTSCDTTETPLSCYTRDPHFTMANPIQKSETKIQLATAATIGFSYEMTANTALDLNYRFLYIPGSSIDMAVNGNQSRVTLNDIMEHQLRAGLRWNIN